MNTRINISFKEFLIETLFQIMLFMFYAVPLRVHWESLRQITGLDGFLFASLAAVLFFLIYASSFYYFKRLAETNPILFGKRRPINKDEATKLVRYLLISLVIYSIVLGMMVFWEASMNLGAQTWFVLTNFNIIWNNYLDNAIDHQGIWRRAL